MSEEVKTTPLYNAEFQRTVLKLIATNTKIALDYGILLKPEYFESQSLRILFTIINEHVLAYERELSLSDLLVSVDNYTSSHGYSSDVYNLLKDEAKDILRLPIKSESFIVTSLVKFCQRQELKNAMLESVKILDKEGSAEQVLKLIDNAVSVGHGGSDGYTFQDLLDLPEEYKKRYNPKKLIRTGFNAYDEAMDGGMAPCEVHIFQSGPKGGKTTLGANIGALNLIWGKVVYHITLELPEIDIAARYGTRMSGLTYREMYNLNPELYRQKMQLFEKFKPKLFIKYYLENTVNTITIRSWISRQRSKTGLSPDLIIIDYDDCLLPVSGKKDDLYDNSGEIYADLKGLAEYFSCPLVSFSQPKREAWEKPNNNEILLACDLAHSARKAHRASSISSLNFARGSETGTLYMDMVRRGEDDIKIPLFRDLSRGRIIEMRNSTQPVQPPPPVQKPYKPFNPVLKPDQQPAQIVEPGQHIEGAFKQ